MVEGNKILLVDYDAVSRNRMYQTLTTAGLHVEPFDILTDFFAGPLDCRLTLIHDMDNAVSDFARQVTQLGKPIPFIPYVDRPMTARVVNAVLSGAIDYIGLLEEEFRIETVLARVGGTINSRQENYAAVSNARGLLRALTKRQMQVLECVSSGMSNREIGEKYRISPRTVEIHRSAMLSRLGVANSTEAVKLAFVAGIGI